jgi:DNA-binding transcriptional regulator LsrR (DeoR family)
MVSSIEAAGTPVTPMASKKKPDDNQKIRRSLTDDEKIKIALDRFRPSADGSSWTRVETLARRYDRDPAVITRAIQSAFERKLVEIRRVENFSAVQEPVRESSLEAKLTRRYQELRNAIVIDEPVGALQPEAVAGDEIHRRLGRAMATVIGTGVFFRDNDVIGLGSGRGVFYVLDALRRFPQLRVANVKIISLTGAVHARDHSYYIEGGEPENFHMDADSHVGLLGLCFAYNVELHQVSSAIACSSEQELERVIGRAHLNEDEWERKPITYALTGVGVLSQGHRFYQEVKSPQKKQPMLEPIHDRLVKLVSLSEEVERLAKDYHPVSDICNRLFYTPPPANVRIPPDKENAIKDLISSINERLVTVSLKQLKKIQSIILVAGTRAKANAIRGLLENPEYKIRTLCTDRDTAEKILSN